MRHSFLFQGLPRPCKGESKLYQKKIADWDADGCKAEFLKVGELFSFDEDIDIPGFQWSYVYCKNMDIADFNRLIYIVMLIVLMYKYIPHYGMQLRSHTEALFLKGEHLGVERSNICFSITNFFLF